MIAQNQVVLDAHLQHQAAGHAVLGHMAHAGGQEGGGVAAEGLAVLEQLHMVGAAQACEYLDELGLPLPSMPAMPRISPLRGRGTRRAGWARPAR